MPTQKRRIQLIQPRLQMRLILTFLGVSIIGLILQFILFAATISSLADDLPQDGPLLLERIPTFTFAVLAITLCVVFPLTIAVGILSTFRIAGPLYRMERHLDSIARGEATDDCRIRQDDELQEFCGKLNAAVNALKQRRLALVGDPDDADEAEEHTLESAA